MSTRLAQSLLVSCLLLGAACASEDGPLLRRRVFAVLNTRAVETPSISLVSRPMHTYSTPLSYHIIDEASRLLNRGILGLGAKRDVRLVGRVTPFCLIQIDSGLNGYLLRTNMPYCLLATRERKLRVNGFARKLYFYVAPACRRFEIRAICESPREGAQLRVMDPRGTVRASAAGEIPKWERLKVKPPVELRGQAWALDIGKHEGLVLDDVDLYLQGEIAPLVAVKPEWVTDMAPKLMPVVNRATGGSDR